MIRTAAIALIGSIAIVSAVLPAQADTQGRKLGVGVLEVDGSRWHSADRALVALGHDWT